MDLLRALPEKTMVLVGKAYNGDAFRALINHQNAWANIPPKRNRKTRICFSRHLYKARNLVERFFNKLKPFRRIATRYDNLAENFLAMTKRASIRICLRFYESTA